MPSLAPLLLTAALQGPPSWSDDVRPILAEHCFECHGPDEATRSAGLRLDSEEGLLGRDGGPGAVDREDPHFSELLLRVSSEDDFDRMPPPEAGSALGEDEIAILRQWIGRGEMEPHWRPA